jgi:WYL domain
MQTVKDIKWAAEQRFQFIEHQAFWCGGLNRSDLTTHFGLSVPQASKDLAAYQALHPENLTYDPSKRRYLRSIEFKAGFITLDSDEFLRASVGQAMDGNPADGELERQPIAEGLPFPHRKIDPYVLQPIAQCVVEGRSVEIKYVSMSTNRPDAMWRRITPHAFGHDGLRWHVRAFCHRSETFKDFIVSRCLDTRHVDVAGATPEVDETWNSLFPVMLVPNPLLSEQQQQIITREYGMIDGILTISVRRAMLYYFNKRLRLDAAPSLDEPHESPLVVKNHDDFIAALAGAMK